MVDIALVLSGLVLLVLGGELLIRGASGVALLLRLTPTVVGLTVVAAGTSMPELVVSLRAALGGSPGLSAGNIVGSNVFNIAAILGVTAVIRPLSIQGNTVRLEWPVMMIAAFQFHLLARDGTIDRLEGAFFAVAATIFVGYSVFIARGEMTKVETEEFTDLTTASFGRTGAAGTAFNVGAVVIGIAVLGSGAELLVRGATSIARNLGVSETLIGLSIVAAGTSLPELATSLVAAYRGRDDMAVANIVGSNIFNVLVIGGITSLVRPLAVPGDIIDRDDLWMLGFSALLFPVMRTGMRITRAEGALLLAGFLGYMWVLASAALG
jgi:cation:H+ antiporter